MGSGASISKVEEQRMYNRANEAQRNLRASPIAKLVAQRVRLRVKEEQQKKTLSPKYLKELSPAHKQSILKERAPDIMNVPSPHFLRQSPGTPGFKEPLS
jgi:hypothetical protein